MRPKAIPPAVLDGAVVRDVAVDGVRLGVGGLDLNERDATIHGFRGDVARNLGRPDLFVDAAQVDTTARLLECHGSHDGLERHVARSEEHTSELQSQSNLVCRLLLEKKKNKISHRTDS